MQKHDELTENSSFMFTTYKLCFSVSFVDEWLAGVSMDGLISVHHMQKTDSPVVELSQAEKVVSIQLDPARKRLATTSSDGFFTFYRMNID